MLRAIILIQKWRKWAPLLPSEQMTYFGIIRETWMCFWRKAFLTVGNHRLYRVPHLRLSASHCLDHYSNKCNTIQCTTATTERTDRNNTRINICVERDACVAERQLQKLFVCQSQEKQTRHSENSYRMSAYVVEVVNLNV